MGHDDDIIDLTPYLEGPASAEEAFAVFGGSGVGARFALPIWRSIYLLDGDRGAVVAVQPGGPALEPIFVLDLKTDPARTTFDFGASDLLERREGTDRVLSPDQHGGDWIGVFIGEKEGRFFYAVVAGIKDPKVLDDAGIRQDFIFLCGECAGLVLHYGLDRAEGSDP